MSGFEDMEAYVNAYLRTFDVQRKLERLVAQLVAIYKARVDALAAIATTGETKGCQ